MIQGGMLVTSGKYRLQKRTRSQVRAIIRKEGKFDGFMCGNKVNPTHIADGWHLGYRLTVNNLDDFENNVEKFETGLRVYTPELGAYAHFYRIIEDENVL